VLGRVALVRTDTVFFRSVRLLLVAATVVPNSPILVTMMMEVLFSCETSVLKIATRRNIREDGILHYFHKSYHRSTYNQSYNNREYHDINTNLHTSAIRIFSMAKPATVTSLATRISYA
jgi:hypothetical protein